VSCAGQRPRVQHGRGGGLQRRGGLASRRRPRVLGAVMYTVCQKRSPRWLAGRAAAAQGRCKAFKSGDAVTHRRCGGVHIRQRRGGAGGMRETTAAAEHACAGRRRRRSTPGWAESGTGTAAVSSFGSGVGRASQRLLGRGIFCSFAD
jgi:hypothetical protein